MYLNTPKPREYNLAGKVSALTDNAPFCSHSQNLALLFLPEVGECIKIHKTYNKHDTHGVGEGRAIRGPHHPTVLPDR